MPLSHHLLALTRQFVVIRKIKNTQPEAEYGFFEELYYNINIFKFTINIITF